MTSWRVAHVVVSDGFAGTERYVANLAGAQHRAGHRVTVLGGDPVRMDAALPGGVHHEEVTTVLGAVRALRRVGPLDVVHAHLTTAETAACLAFPLRRHAPIVVSTRHIARRRGSTWVARAMAVWIRQRLDLQIAISNYVARNVDGRSVVLLTGVSPRALGSAERAVVLVTQRLESEKDTATAIRAWALSGLDRQGWRLEVLGAGREHRRLEALAGELCVAASVDFVGWADDVEARMEAAALLLAPAPGEPFGLAVAEAMAWGLPVVAAAAGGHLETVGAVADARMFAPGDADEAATLLRELAADPVGRSSYGRSLRAYQRSHLTLEGHAAAVSEVYRATRRAKDATIRNRRHDRIPAGPLR